MPILINLDVQLAKQKMGVNELTGLFVFEGVRAVFGVAG